jgi:uncharacterized protein (DUF433 family)
MDGYPFLAEADVMAALRYAADLVELEGVVQT